MSPRRAVLLAYTLSGTAGLLYEVAWVRLLTLHLGHATAAVGTVLAAFMGGLALGAILGGRYAPSWSPHGALRAYAGAELAIALCALGVPSGLKLLQPLLAWAYADGSGVALFGVVRVMTSLFLVTVPATLMGATLPLAVRWFVRDPTRAGPDTGRLYAANTAGAAVGAMLASFVLLPAVGFTRTTWTGVGLNVLAALFAVAAVRRTPMEPAPPPAERRSPWTSPRGGARGARDHVARAARTDKLPPAVAALVLGLSGFVALTYEVTWTRLCALVLGPTTYAFGLMVAIFIAGLALGASAGARWSRGAAAARALGLALVGVAAGGWLVIAVAGTLPVRIAALLARPDTSFGSAMAIEALGLALLLFPATFALGTAFPLAVAAAAGPARPVARDVAVVYAGNTVGAIAGSLASSFVLLPRLGLRGTGLAAAALAAVAGGALAWRCLSRPWRFLAAIPVVAVLTAGFSLPEWNRALLASGAYKYAAYLGRGDLETALEAGTLLFYAEGPTGTVSVRRTAGTLSLAIDGKVDASNGGDMLTQKLLAHLPLLLHPSPRQVAIIGLGSGVTAGAALVHPVEQVEVVEISPEVVRAATWFAADNRQALDHPRMRLVIGDARTHFALGRRQYDVIISEPSNPWMAGVAGLFTREFFSHLRARLAPGGIVCQWAHTYDITEPDFRSIVATFLAVFPDATLWLVGDADVLLMAGDEPLDRRLGRLSESWSRPGVRDDLATVGIRSPFGVLSLFVAAGPALSAYSAGAVLQTDESLALEFSAPRGLYASTGPRNAQALRELAWRSPRPPAVEAALTKATAADWKARGLMLLQAEAPAPAYDDLARAASADPSDLETLEALERAAVGTGRLEEALDFLTELGKKREGEVTARIAAAHLLASLGRPSDALRVAEEARARAPRDARVLAQHASILADLGDVERLVPLVRALETLAPDDPETRYYRATAAFLTGDTEGARNEARVLLERSPDHARAWNLLGAAAAAVGRRDEARQAFLTAIERNPRDPIAYANLGTLELETANPIEAVRYLSEALTLDPTSAATRQALAQALELAGYRRRAARIRTGSPRS